MIRRHRLTAGRAIRGMADRTIELGFACHREAVARALLDLAGLGFSRRKLN